MKKFILMIGLLAMNVSFAAESPSSINAVVNNLNLDVSDIESNGPTTDPVIMSFSRKDFQIQILDNQDAHKKHIQLIINGGALSISVRTRNVQFMINCEFTFKKG